MNSFGTRLTGSEGQHRFIKWLKNELRKMDINVYSDPHFLTAGRKDKSLVIRRHGKRKYQDFICFSVFRRNGP